MIVLDIHGVCADLVTAYLNWHEIDRNSFSWPKGSYNLQDITGKPFDTLPFDFWQGLNHTPELPAIFELLKDKLVILASKSCSHYCTLGTFVWVDKYFHGIPYLPCHDLKANYFAEDAILIDDSEEEVNAWRGPAILVPRHWNKGEGDPVEHIRHELAKALYKLRVR